MTRFVMRSFIDPSAALDEWDTGTRRLPQAYTSRSTFRTTLTGYRIRKAMIKAKEADVVCLLSHSSQRVIRLIYARRRRFRQ